MKQGRHQNFTSMRGSVEFQDERLELELPEDKLVGLWEAPAGLDGQAAIAAVRDALERPLDFPPVRKAVVPGDRVAIALDSSLGQMGPIIGTILELLKESGVRPEDVTVVATEGRGEGLPDDLPPGVSLEHHDCTDRRRLAYLATTKGGRRIYLNRTITDADVVIPIGRLGYDPIQGYRGPWSVLFPCLSDLETNATYRQAFLDDRPGQVTPRLDWDESFEVSWLLGTQYYLGLVPGRSGLAQVVGGLAEAIRGPAIEAIDRLWSFRPLTRAECVIAGIGRPGVPTVIDDLVEGLVTASRLVTRGGKIVALSRTQDAIGPSLQRLRDAGDPAQAVAALRGHDADPDSVAGRRLAQVLAWADVYLYSRMDRELVEDLCMIPIDHVDDARRLVARSSACLLVSQAELVRGTARDEETD